MGFFDDLMKPAEPDSEKVKAVKGFIQEQDLSFDEMATVSGWLVTKSLGQAFKQATEDD